MNKNTLISLTSILSAFLLTSCASPVQKAYIPATANPQEEIARLNTDLREAMSRNIDVLAESDFKKASKWSNEAKDSLKSNKKQSDVLDDIRTSRGYLMHAEEVAKGRQAKVPGLFESRQAAIRAGAFKYPETTTVLKKIDSDVADNANDLANVKVDRIAKWQQAYTDLEKRAVVLTQLAKPMSIVIGAKKDDADRKVPQTLKKAQLSLQNAETVIGSNVQNPAAYSYEVQMAQNDANMLNDVMAVIKSDKKLSETAAVKLVMQNREIAKLNKTGAELEDQNQQLSSDLDSKNRDLTMAESDLSATAASLTAAEAAVRMQEAIDDARQQFKSDEAEAFQQGNNLVIRMKKMNFAIGKADLPAASMAGLEKISEIANNLNASEIKVEGHADSTGTAQINKAISNKRADAVAEYFKSNGFTEVEAEGYGFEKPIASNKSKAGRAQNRRVDIVITPSMTR